MARFCWLRVCSVVAVSWYARCSRPAGRSSQELTESLLESRQVMSYMGKFGETKCHGSGTPVWDADSCKLLAEWYCPNPAVKCSLAIVEKKGTEAPRGCTWYFDPNVNFDSVSVDDIPVWFNEKKGTANQNSKLACYMDVHPTSNFIRQRVNWRRAKRSIQAVAETNRTTFLAFAMASSIYKGEDEVYSGGKKGYTVTTNTTVKIDGWTNSLEEGYVVIKYKGRKACVPGQEQDSANRMVRDYAKKKILKEVLYRDDVETAGFAIICYGAKGKGSIEVGVFKSEE